MYTITKTMKGSLGHPHKMFVFPLPERPTFFGKGKKSFRCLLSFFVCFEGLIPVTIYYSYSDISIALVKRLQAPFEVTKSRNKISVLDKVIIYNFPFVSPSFLFCFFARLTDPLSLTREREKERGRWDTKHYKKRENVNRIMS